MWSIRLNIERVKETDPVFLLSCNTNPSAPHTNDNMLVLMHFETAVPAGSDLEIPEMKFCRFSVISDQCLSYDLGPVSVTLLISFGTNAFPGKVAFVFIVPGLILILFRSFGLVPPIAE